MIDIYVYTAWNGVHKYRGSIDDALSFNITNTVTGAIYFYAKDDPQPLDDDDLPEYVSVESTPDEPTGLGTVVTGIHKRTGETLRFLRIYDGPTATEAWQTVEGLWSVYKWEWVTKNYTIKDDMASPSNPVMIGDLVEDTSVSFVLRYVIGFDGFMRVDTGAYLPYSGVISGPDWFNDNGNFKIISRN